MDSKVIVVADATTGSVVNVSQNNPEYGWIRVKQTKVMTDETGFLRRREVSAVVPGLLADLKAMNLHANQEIEGKIVIEESLTPFNEQDPQKDLKVAGTTGIACTLEGAPIYRRTRFTFTMTAINVLVKHDNFAELKSAYATQKASNAAMKPNRADFELK